MAWYAYRMGTLVLRSKAASVAIGITVLLLPSVFLNSAMWGQCDSIYSAFALAGIYYVSRGQPWLGMTLVGVAFAVKLQTLFIIRTARTVRAAFDV